MGKFLLILYALTAEIEASSKNLWNGFDNRGNESKRISPAKLLIHGSRIELHQFLPVDFAGFFAERC